MILRKLFSPSYSAAQLRRPAFSQPFDAVELLVGVPVLGQDGQTVYLVQAARSVRGGVAFTF